jgi:hypothetical protein
MVNAAATAVAAAAAAAARRCRCAAATSHRTGSVHPAVMLCDSARSGAIAVVRVVRRGSSCCSPGMIDPRVDRLVVELCVPCNLWRW